MNLKLYVSFFSFLFFSSILFTQNQKSVLVFTKTAGYRHQSIEKGVQLIKKLGKEHQFKVHHTEDANVFTNDGLNNYDLIIFLSTTGDILNAGQQKAFENYIRNGHSFLGVHAAADTEYEWPWYGKLVGAYFESHPNNPNIRDAVIEVKNKKHSACRHLKSKWKRADEWYNYKNINPEIQVLMTLDEKSYEGGTNGENHPIAWYHEYDGGKAFYTGGGHTEASYDDPDFIQHLLGGILYCLE